MGERPKMATIVNMQKLFEIESNLRHHTIHSIFSRSPMTKRELEIEVLRLLRRIGEDKDGKQAIEFVNQISPDDIKKAHEVYPSDLVEAYAKLDKEMRIAILPPSQLEFFNNVNVLSFYKQTDANRAQALAIVGSIASILEQKLRT